VQYYHINYKSNRKLSKNMLHEIYYVSVKITYKPTLFILLNIKLKLKKNTYSNHELWNYRMKRYSRPFVCCKNVWLSGNTAPLIFHHGQLHAPAAILPGHKPLLLTK